ncbi:hypothetical protein F5879DRAFT_975038 [Lentinula edodes]|nr:hypothetical protein F5879DRAFT_975038 [Lentinula edodes]
MANFLPLNAVSNVIIVSGEIGTPNETWKGPTIPVVLQRQSVPSLETGVLDDYATKIENRTFSDYCKPYPDPPFEIPAPANLTLQIRLGNVLSEGQSSIVFKCECFIPYGNETLEYIIPPMVVKLAKRYKSDDVKKEAIMYEGIKCLQGSSIPRCYGFFQVRALEFFDFGPMSILLLEELGGLLTLDQPVPDSAKSDIEGLCSDLAHLRIVHDDMGYQNILSTLSHEQGGLPSLPSPISGRTYGWRLAGFNGAFRTSTTLENVQSFYNYHLPEVLENVYKPFEK